MFKWLKKKLIGKFVTELINDEIGSIGREDNVYSTIRHESVAKRWNKSVKEYFDSHFLQCFRCGLVACKRSSSDKKISQQYFKEESNWRGGPYYSAYCDTCLPIVKEEKAVKEWADANPDKAAECKAKHDAILKREEALKAKREAAAAKREAKKNAVSK